jgi:cytochrome P450
MPLPTAETQSVKSRLSAPGPKGHPLLGHIREYAADVLNLVDSAFAAHGDVIRLRLGQTVTVIRHPDHVRQVLQDNHTNYHKSFLYKRMKPLVGEGLLTSEGDTWRRNRRMAQPAFHHQRLAEFAAVMNGHIADLLDDWAAPARTGDAVDVAAAMTSLTFGIAGATLMGVDLRHDSKAVGEALRVAMQVTNRRLTSLAMIPPSLPTPMNLRFRKALALIDGLVGDIITGRQSQADPPHDFLAMLMAARDEEDGSRLSERQLRDEVVTMFIAGHETTAHMLSWAWYLLATHPEIEARVHDEVATVLGGRPAGVADLGKLPYLRRVLDEVLRLYPPAYLIGRKAIADDTIGGFHVPAGSSVILSAWSTQRMAAYWERPDAFDPDRFLPERSDGRPRYAFYPFAGGPRQCIGRDVAMMEGMLIAAAVLQRYRTTLVPDHPIVMERSVTLYPRHGVKVTLRQRSIP